MGLAGPHRALLEVVDSSISLRLLIGSDRSSSAGRTKSNSFLLDLGITSTDLQVSFLFYRPFLPTFDLFFSPKAIRFLRARGLFLVSPFYKGERPLGKCTGCGGWPHGL